MLQVGEASLEGESNVQPGMTASQWKVATALFTAGEVIYTCLHHTFCLTRH